MYPGSLAWTTGVVAVVRYVWKAGRPVLLHQL